MKHLNLGFIGFGLIGGSIAKALKHRGANIRVLVYSRRHNPDLVTGVKEGIINDLVYEIDDAFSSCDIVFLCAPVQTNISILPKLSEYISPECIITDVGSVKGEICRAAATYGLSSRFIGGHPMAGSEKTGYLNSSASLLENAYYLLTPSEDNSPDDIQTMKELVTLTGANCVILPYDKHDEITAAISHVPHLIAVALVNLVRAHDDDEQTMKKFAAGGFRDITRIASSSPKMWEDICMSNPDAINSLLAEFEQLIAAYRKQISASDGTSINKAFEEAGQYRDSIPAKNTGALPKFHEIYINIDDRAGAIATVATTLSIGGISIRNIGIVHNREFADGVLRIELYNESDATKARELLKQNKYDIVDR